ncbi:MAG TPA: response regulator transcription factor [Patescibacteria group bacterium]|nr:response regulator transcription factor [Patescibacteria group bacterium]
MPLRVVVVEDDARYRSSLEQLFAHAPGFSLAASFPAAVSAVREAEQAAGQGTVPGWDLAVMDIEMPVMNGIEATRRLKAAMPGLKVVVLTVFEQPATILEAICAGADGYMLKRSRANELLDGLRAVAEGGAPLTPNVARSLLDLVREVRIEPSPEQGASPTRLDLTEREQQVLRSLVEGLSYKQAADILGISLGTVRTHVTSVYRKLQVHSVAEAVPRALKERLV